MYPFVRYMKTLKAFVKTFAWPEACMAEGYLAEECLAFCFEFLKNSILIEELLNCNEDVMCNEHIIEGRPLQKPHAVTLSDKERDIAHCMHLEELHATDSMFTRNETLSWKLHTDIFAEWIRAKVPINSESYSEKLK